VKFKRKRGFESPFKKFFKFFKEEFFLKNPELPELLFCGKEQLKGLREKFFLAGMQSLEEVDRGDLGKE